MIEEGECAKVRGTSLNSRENMILEFPSLQVFICKSTCLLVFGQKLKKLSKFYILVMLYMPASSEYKNMIQTIFDNKVFMFLYYIYAVQKRRFKQKTLKRSSAL